MTLDYSRISNVQVEDAYSWDYPEFADAYIGAADYDGRPMTDDELEELNQDLDYVYDAVLEHFQ